MKQINVFEVRENADNIEGRGPMIHVAYFTNVADANRAAKGKGVMGVRDNEVNKTQLTVFDSYDEYIEKVTENTRNQALAKLTRAEKIALGLGKE